MKKIDKSQEIVSTKEELKRVGTCSCGRSPTGDCCGWHALSEDLYRQKLAEYDAKMLKPTRQFGS
jgi:hypothetical protein